jgi:hypothetical protein
MLVILRMDSFYTWLLFRCVVFVLDVTGLINQIVAIYQRSVWSKEIQPLLRVLKFTLPLTERLLIKSVNTKCLD